MTILPTNVMKAANKVCVCACVCVRHPPEDRELVREVLDELPQHEEDYLDLTLEDESQLIATMRSYLGEGGGGGGGGIAHTQ